MNKSALKVPWRLHSLSKNQKLPTLLPGKRWAKPSLRLPHPSDIGHCYTMHSQCATDNFRSVGARSLSMSINSRDSFMHHHASTFGGKHVKNQNNPKNERQETHLRSLSRLSHLSHTWVRAICANLQLFTQLPVRMQRLHAFPQHRVKSRSHHIFIFTDELSWVRKLCIRKLWISCQKPGIWMFASLISSSIFLLQLHGNDSAWLANQVHGHSPTASGRCNVPGIYSGAISTR